jgi:hypothetical protein
LRGSGQPIAEQDIRESFIGMLISDVIEALKRAEKNDTQGARRNLIRVLFAAIEGLVWELREHVQSIAKNIDELPMLIELALNETSYSVSNNGEVFSQHRFLPLDTNVRLATAVAQRICPALICDFGTSGWKDFKRAMSVRHRVTHPKTIADLSITDDEIAIAKTGFAWLMQHTEMVERETVDAARSHLNDLAQLVKALISGDPAALALYRKTSMQIDD